MIINNKKYPKTVDVMKSRVEFGNDGITGDKSPKDLMDQKLMKIFLIRWPKLIQDKHWIKILKKFVSIIHHLHDKRDSNKAGV